MKKRAITLLEVMIVILLIGIIGGVVSYNLKGTLDKGKNFRSKEGAKRLEDILNLQIQLSNLSADSFISSEPNNLYNVLKCVENSGLVSDSAKFVKDGWGSPYTIVLRADNTVEVWSPKSREYERTHQ